MSNTSTLYTYELSDLTAWDVANVLEFATSRIASIWLFCHQNHIPRTLAYKSSFIRHLQWEVDVSVSSRFVFPYIHVSLVLNIHPTMPDLLQAMIGRFSRFQTGIITAEQLHDEFFLHCSPNGPQVSSNHRVVPNYRYDWWKDRFDRLGLDLPVLNVHEVMEMTQDHFEQLLMGAMLVPGPAVTGQVDGGALFNQIVVVRTHLQHLGEAMSPLLEQKHQIAAAAAYTMSQLEAPIAELQQQLLNSRQQFAGKP
ncbi:uncharacterized protein F5147DRAFT_781280 [Suillus discolor]|uniref:Uncharacterized protein n=1 Tax=Suillus discolor TaxID=1912936 RepID=A0A9P7JM69_9AGAM|nr:uncharacterized protein F5147DRAFT_781280 [Suillus discolor]KAG2087516.1 hypothetical protein F5147DRAFT_781280 [Suillus discolor]